MKKLSLLGTSALRSVAFIGAAIALSNPAFAQEVAEEEDAAQTLDSETEIESGEAASGEAASGETIEVTGSRIRRPNLESAVPINSIGGEEFFEQGRVSVGDTLNELPALRSTVSQSNSTQFLGTAGLNLLDLRGLGVGRTLVLQNGRRHVAGDLRYSASTVDVNQIPSDLIERVDIVTGGNSAIYGSDAIAGVVNFIMKRDYDGAQLRVQGGISDEGDAGNYLVSAIAGKNFGGGRGNITGSLEYSRTNQYFGGNREYYAIPSGFVTVDSDSGPGVVNGGDGVPDRRFFSGVTSPVFSDDSVFLDFYNREAGGFVPAYHFNPDGTLTRLTCERVGLPPYGSCVNLSANRYDTFRDAGQLQLQPSNDRINANLMGHFTVSDAFEPFFEAKFVRNKVRGTGFSGPAFSQFGNTFGDASRERIFPDNPYLTDQAEGVIRGLLGDYYADLNGNNVPDYYEGEYTGGNGVDDIDEFGFTTLTNLLGLGVRDEDIRRDTYRLVAGVRGTFNDDWSYELSANYGRTNERVNIGGNVNLQRYLLALQAVRDPATGNIVCRAKIDPAARLTLPVADQAEAQRRLAEDVAQCVPINILGEGNVTQAARDYILQDASTSGRLTQFVVNGFVSGDSSQVFELPGGPIGFALGAEYRRERVVQRSDALISSGLTFYNAIGNLTDAPAFEVKEAFGEIRIPLLANTPFFEELTVSGAARVADYSGATGTVFAWNAGAEWAPVRDIRFRGNYSRAVRAPSILELYDPLGQNFAPPPSDPCSLRNINQGSSTRQANCRAAGVPAGYDYVYAESLEILSGGNVNLTEETSDSMTLGAVFLPRFIPGLSLSVDYYDIEVNKVISSVSAQDIIDSCYDASDLNNQFCALIQRAGAGGGPNGEIPGQILEGTLAVTPLNFAKLKVRGIDAEVAYRHDLGNIGTLSARAVYTHVLQNDNYLDPTDPTRADQVLYEMGDPKHLFNVNVDLKSGPITLGYEMRYIGRQLSVSTADYENYFSKQGRDPVNIDYADPIWATDVIYHDLRLAVDAGPRFNFYIGVDNVLDRMPPFHNTGIGDGSAIWSNLGRYFYAGAVAKF
jgi:outer membrane receptor protein involved in Fe transport